METLQQMLMTVIAAFAFLILIAKIASAATNGRADHPEASNISGHDLGTALQEELKSWKAEKSSSITKSKKKVRFAVDHVDHQEFVVNKTVAGPSETKSIAFEKNCSEVEDDCGNESVSGYVDYDETKEGGIMLVEERMIGEENVGKCDENRMCMKLQCDDGIDEAEKEKEGSISEEDDSSDDDWEGVERSDLEKVFALAVDYCKVDDNLLRLESDVQMQLYGLHKVATEGPCYEAQPMALKVSARAKWNSWQKLGNMNPDAAMEKYIALLSELVPGWSQGIHSVDKH